MLHNKHVLLRWRALQLLSSFSYMLEERVNTLVLHYTIVYGLSGGMGWKASVGNQAGDVVRTAGGG